MAHRGALTGNVGREPDVPEPAPWCCTNGEYGTEVDPVSWTELWRS